MMKKIIIISLSVVSTLFLISCNVNGEPVYGNMGQPIGQPAPVYTTEETLSMQRLAKCDVRFLFEIDGTRVYRFFDGGCCKYFAVHHGNEESTMITNTTTTHNRNKNRFLQSDQAVQTVYDN